MRKRTTQAERLAINALNNVAFTIAPYPDNVKPEQAEEAITALRQRLLVHGPQREPNLTPAGVEYAQNLAADTKSEGGDEDPGEGDKKPEGDKP